MPIPVGAAILGASALNVAGQHFANKRMESMSNTSYSRAMSDLRRSGLNPILVGKFGGAQVAPQVNPFATATDMAIKSYQAKSNVDLQQSQQEHIASQVESLAVQRGLTSAQTNVAVQSAAKVVQEIQTEVQRTGLTEAQARGQIQYNEVKDIVVKFIEESQISDLTGSSGSVVKSVVDTVFDFIKSLPFGHIESKDFFNIDVN